MYSLEKNRLSPKQRPNENESKDSSTITSKEINASTTKQNKTKQNKTKQKASWMVRYKFLIFSVKGDERISPVGQQFN